MSPQYFTNHRQQVDVEISHPKMQKNKSEAVPLSFKKKIKFNPKKQKPKLIAPATRLKREIVVAVE
jgi:hypothetical protein